VLQREGRSLDPFLREVELWVNEPYRLFRGYSLHYMHLIFSETDIQLGIIHESRMKDVPTKEGGGA